MTRAIRDFNKKFLNHPELDATIVPIGDGIGIGARVD
jgi:predicted O-methyltransferase YrrM